MLNLILACCVVVGVLLLTLVGTCLFMHEVKAFREGNSDKIKPHYIEVLLLVNMGYWGAFLAIGVSFYVYKYLLLPALGAI